MKFFIEDINIFYVTLYGGIFIGLLFDFYRAFKNNFKILKYISFVFDVIFWIVVTAFIFIVVNAVEKFDLRYYHFVALFLGFILYYNTISKYILIFFNKIISFITGLFKKTIHYIVSFFNNLYYILIYSIHFIFDIICYIPTIFFTSKRRRKNKKGANI